MYFAISTLLMAAGIAIAWRSNPLYSLGKTVRFVGITAIALGMYVAAILGVIRIAQKLDRTGAGLALGTTILLGTLFLIWVIVTASTPHVVTLPRGTKLVSTNRARVVPWFVRSIVVLLLFPLCVAVTHGESRDFVLVIGGMFAGLIVVLVFTMFITALGMDRSLTSLEAAPWVHWTYSTEAWSVWREALVARTAATPRPWLWSRDWMKLLLPLTLVAVAIVVLSAAGIPFVWNIFYLVAIVIVIVGTIELLARFGSRASERLRRRLLQAPAETYAGDAGIFCDGVYLPWMSPSAYLVSAAFDERTPRSIDLSFTQMVSGIAGTVHFTQSVLVPPDAADDLRILQTRLVALCPSASVSLIR